MDESNIVRDRVKVNRNEIYNHIVLHIVLVALLNQNFRSHYQEWKSTTLSMKQIDLGKGERLVSEPMV